MGRRRTRHRKHKRRSRKPMRRIIRRIVVRRIIRKIIVKRPIKRIIIKRIIRRPIRKVVRKIIVKRPIKRIIVRRIIVRKKIIIKRVAFPRLPRVKIMYDETYDEAIHQLVEKRHTHMAHMGGQLFARRLRKATKPMLKRFLVTAENVTGLKWRWHIVRCYVAHDIPFDFDNPMTIKIRGNMKDATETFFHELAHQMELQNNERIRHRNNLSRKYRNEPKDTREHIFAHAVLWKVYEKLYGRARLKKIIAGYRLWPEHYRGWQIVKKEGADNILKAYLK